MVQPHAHSSSTSGDPDDRRVYLEPGDPTPELCTTVTTVLAADNDTDLMLVARLNVFLHYVEEQLRNPAATFFPAPLVVYAARSLMELDQLQLQYHRIQQAAGRLKVGQVVMPCLSFQVVCAGVLD